MKADSSDSLCAQPALNRRHASNSEGSVSLAGTNAMLRKKPLAASMRATQLKLPSCSVRMGKPPGEGGCFRALELHLIRARCAEYFYSIA